MARRKKNYNYLIPALIRFQLMALVICPLIFISICRADSTAPSLPAVLAQHPVVEQKQDPNNVEADPAKNGPADEHRPDQERGLRPESETASGSGNEQEDQIHQHEAQQQRAREPEAGEEQPEETFVDLLHAEISKSIQGTALWMDSFFGDRRYLYELNQSFIRFRYDFFLEDGSPFVRKQDLQMRFVLPQLREKTRLVLAGTPKDDREFPAVDANIPSDRLAAGDDRNVSAAVHQTMRESAKSSLVLRAGLQFHSGGPMLLLGPRYRILFPLDRWNLRFVEELVWRSRKGWESRATVDVERPLSSGMFFRATNDWFWTELEDGLLYAVAFKLGQPISPQRAIDYEWINILHTRPIHELTEVILRVRYRQQFWRKWLYFEINPQCRFPRNRSFDPAPGILFTIDMIFGSY